jgi:GTP-binding protein Era
MGIVNGENYQMILSDTPGIVKPVYKLHENMMRFVRTAISDADIILYVTDVYETRDKHEQYIDKLKKVSVPVIVAINKTDQSEPGALEILSNEWKLLLPHAEVLTISALYKQNTELLFDTLLGKLPEGPVYYPDDSLTDRPERFFVSEIVREKIFLNYKRNTLLMCGVLVLLRKRISSGSMP